MHLLWLLKDKKMHKEKLQKTNTVLLESWQAINLRLSGGGLIFC